MRLWQAALGEAERHLVKGYDTALRRVENALTSENDCSTFWLLIAGGADPVTVTATPDQIRHILAYLKEAQ